MALQDEKIIVNRSDMYYLMVKVDALHVVARGGTVEISKSILNQITQIIDNAENYEPKKNRAAKRKA